MEIALSILHWALNLMILAGAVLYSVKLWDDKRRALWAWSLFGGGVLWHGIRGFWTFRQGACEPFVPADGFLSQASKCIPPTADDVVWAQIAIFTGLFLIIADRFRRFGEAESE